METTKNYVTKEDMLDFIKFTDYYEIADVMRAFKHGNFSEYPYSFLMYILHVLAPEMGYTEYGEQVTDKTGESIYEEFHKDHYYKMLEEYIPVMTKELAKECVRIATIDGNESRLAMLAMRNMSIMIYRNYIGRENPNGRMNQEVLSFNHLYKKGLGEKYGKFGKVLTEKILNVFYAQDYDDIYKPRYTLPQ